MQTIKNILWFITAAVVIVTFWSVLLAALSSWIPHSKEWNKADRVRTFVAAVHRVSKKASAWVLWVLRPLPLLIPIGQRAEGTRKVLHKIRPVSARTVERDEQENPTNRKVTVDFRYAIGALALFVAAALLGVVGWVSLPALSVSVALTLVGALIVAVAVGGVLMWWKHNREPRLA